MIELTKDYIENLKSIIEAKDDAKAQEVLHELYPADIAELARGHLSLSIDGWRQSGGCLDGAG